MPTKQSQLKSYNFAPFGTRCKRFGMIASHPDLDHSGLYSKRPQACDPCRYHPQPMHKVFQVNRNRTETKDPWRYKTELEAWSKNLGYRNQRILEQRRWQATLLGPAWTDVPAPTRYEPVCKNVGFGRITRFKPSRDRVPGPGTYYKAFPFKAPNGPHSTRPTLEREELCRFKDTCPRWSLAPNRYTLVDKDSIDQKPKKIVSLKGPYELFTGKRDGSTIKNHFSNQMKCSAASWPLALPGSLEKYKKLHFGKLNKTNRDVPYRGRTGMVDLAMCIKKPTDPGPTHYNVDKPKEFKDYVNGFNSSYDRPPGYQRTIVWPGVGRYKVRTLTPCGIPGLGHRHVFLSKIGRTIGAVIQQPMNSF